MIRDHHQSGVEETCRITLPDGRIFEYSRREFETHDREITEGEDPQLKVRGNSTFRLDALAAAGERIARPLDAAVTAFGEGVRAGAGIVVLILGSLLAISLVAGVFSRLSRDATAMVEGLLAGTVFAIGLVRLNAVQKAFRSTRYGAARRIALTITVPMGLSVVLAMSLAPGSPAIPSILGSVLAILLLLDLIVQASSATAAPSLGAHWWYGVDSFAMAVSTSVASLIGASFLLWGASAGLASVWLPGLILCSIAIAFCILRVRIGKCRDLRPTSSSVALNGP